MSQLSSGGRKTRAKTKKLDKTIVFLISFAIFAILVTVICITITINSKKTGDESLLEALSHKGSSETADRIALGDRIWTNGLETKTVEYSEGDVVSNYIFSTENLPHKYEINYEQISGLKNKEVENAINKEIEEKVNSLKDKLVEGSEYDRIAINSYISGSFSDVLSVEFAYSLIDLDGEYNSYQSTGLNYRLDTGEKLKFNDLFRKDTSIKTILSQALYEAFAWNHAYSEQDEFSSNFDKTDYGYIENQTFKAVAEYNKNPDIDFYFTPSAIFAIIRDFQFSINMKDCASELAIFTKYRAEKLYESSSLQKEFYACTDGYIADSVEVEGLKSDNFYYEILAYPNGDENVEVKAKVEEKINQKLNHYFEISKQNPDKAYMVSIMYYYDGSSDNEKHYYNYNGYVSELDLDYFRKHKDEIVAKARTMPAVEVNSYDFSQVDEEVEYYEAFSAYTQDHLQDEIEEDITTKEEKIQQDLEWEQEKAKWEAMEENDEEL